MEAWRIRPHFSTLPCCKVFSCCCCCVVFLQIHHLKYSTINRLQMQCASFMRFNEHKHTILKMASKNPTHTHTQAHYNFFYYSNELSQSCESVRVWAVLKHFLLNGSFLLFLLTLSLSLSFLSLPQYINMQLFPLLLPMLLSLLLFVLLSYYVKLMKRIPLNWQLTSVWLIHGGAKQLLSAVWCV